MIAGTYVREAYDIHILVFPKCCIALCFHYHSQTRSLSLMSKNTVNILMVEGSPSLAAIYVSYLRGQDLDLLILEDLD